MPVTFGSVGDIISLSLLIKGLIKSLNKSRGASAEYRNAIGELYSLDHSLIEVESVFRSCDHTIQLNALRVTTNERIEQCRKCIIGFRQHIEKTFKESLQQGTKASLAKQTAFKLRWQLSEKERLANFRSEVNAHCLAINMLLATTGISLTRLTEEDLHAELEKAEGLRLQDSASQASANIDIKRSVEEGNALIKTVASEIRSFISEPDMDYFRKIGATVTLFMQRLWKLNSETYNAVVALQDSIPACIQRCWTQEPALLEDALGRRFPLHLEFLGCWEAFEAVLKIRFKDLPGHKKILQQEYALHSKVLKRDLKRSTAFDRCFLPGQRVDMSMIFNGGSGHLSSCPGCHLLVNKSEEELGAEIQCPGCQMWYQRINERIEESEPLDLDSSSSPLRSQSPTENSSKRKRRHGVLQDEDEPAQFRRVRLKYWGPSPESGSSSDHELRHGKVYRCTIKGCNGNEVLDTEAAWRRHEKLNCPFPHQTYTAQFPIAQRKMEFCVVQTNFDSTAVESTHTGDTNEIIKDSGINPNPNGIYDRKLELEQRWHRQGWPEKGAERLNAAGFDGKEVQKWEEAGKRREDASQIISEASLKDKSSAQEHLRSGLLPLHVFKVAAEAYNSDEGLSQRSPSEEPLPQSDDGELEEQQHWSPHIGTVRNPPLRMQSGKLVSQHDDSMQRSPQEISELSIDSLFSDDTPNL